MFSGQRGHCNRVCSVYPVTVIWRKYGMAAHDVLAVVVIRSGFVVPAPFFVEKTKLPNSKMEPTCSLSAGELLLVALVLEFEARTP